MPLTFSCPNCSAPLDLEDAHATTIRCPYCSTSVIVPQELRLKEHATGSSAGLDPSQMQLMVDLIKSGRKIEAIKLFRQATNVGLKEAKDAIDGMEVAVSASSTGSVGEFTPLTPSPGSSFDANSLTSSSRRGCIGPASIIFILLVAIVPILIAMASPGGPLSGLWARINPSAIGRVTLAFGKEGTGPGYFTKAQYIALDNNGHIFVAESIGGRVQVFDENGKYLTQWNVRREQTGDIYISGLAANRDGAVYVIYDSQLYVYDGLNGSLLGTLDHPDGWGFTNVTLAPDGSVVAAWYKNRDDLLRFDRNGQLNLLLKNAIENITSDSEMDSRVAVDGSGNIYELAYFNEGVFIFSSDGQYISRFGSMGDADGQFTSPRAIAVDNLGRIFICDFPGVLIFASDGRYLDTLPVNAAAMGLAFDDQNNLYMVAGEQVLRYTLK